MSYTRVRLIRHATAEHMQHPEIVAGHAPKSLLVKPKGLGEARLRGAILQNAGVQFEGLYSATLFRSGETLRELAAGANVAYEFEQESDSRLNEQCLGEHEGQPRSVAYTNEVRANMDNNGAAYVHPGVNEIGMPGESLLAATDRLFSFFRTARVRHDSRYGDVIAVTSKIVTRGLLARYQLGDIDGRAGADIDPLAMQALVNDQQKWPTLSPCSETHVIVDGPADNFRLQIDHNLVGLELPDLSQQQHL